MSIRSDRIKKAVPLDKLLKDYGYDIYLNGSDQQFKCDLHGSGRDNKPSARYYHSTQTWYCFACGKVRDVISTTMEKGGLEYNDACRYLEKRYDIGEWVEKKSILDNEERYEIEENIDWQKRVVVRLKSLVKDRLISLDASLKFWEAIDILMVNNNTEESKWKNIFDKLESIANDRR